MRLVELVGLYGLSAIVFFAVDLTWIGLVARDFYRRQLDDLLRAEALWPAAIVFYAIYIAGIVAFAVVPGLATGSAVRTAVLGAGLGFFAYATFDLTCLALFRGFPVAVVIVDMAWGTFLTGFVALATFLAGRWLGLGT